MATTTPVLVMPAAAPLGDVRCVPVGGPVTGCACFWAGHEQAEPAAPVVMLDVGAVSVTLTVADAEKLAEALAVLLFRYPDSTDTDNAEIGSADLHGGDQRLPGPEAG